MNENDIVNSFLNLVFENGVEKSLQDRCKDLRTAFTSLNQDLQKDREQLLTKENEFVRIRHYLEACYQLIIDTHKQANGSK